MTHKVFVYGTLRPKGAEATHILYDYEMYNYHNRFPYIVESVAFDDVFVRGNVLTVDDKQLAQLDRIEGVERGLYTRETVEVKDIETKDTITAFVYVAGDIAPSFIPSGDWLDRSGV